MGIGRMISQSLDSSQRDGSSLIRIKKMVQAKNQEEPCVHSTNTQDMRKILNFIHKSSNEVIQVLFIELKKGVLLRPGGGQNSTFKKAKKRLKIVPLNELTLKL